MDDERPAEEFQLTVRPSSSLHGEIGDEGGLPLPGDKSLSHRAALLGAMADGVSMIRNFLVSGVTQPMLDALTVLEIPFQLSGSFLKIEGIGLLNERKYMPVKLDCGNSATTLRLLAGALAAWGRPAVLDGSPGLRRRPMRRIIQPLQEMGVKIEGQDGCAPITLEDSPRPLKPLRHMLTVASAQVKSCLLLAALSADGESELVEPGPSRDHTERMLKSMGINILNGQRQGPVSPQYWTLVRPPIQPGLAALDLILPGDVSAASFLIVAALITPDSQITIRKVGLNATRIGMLEALIEMGGRIEFLNQGVQGGEPVGDLNVTFSDLEGICVKGERVVRMIDEFPAFAVAAAHARGETIVAEAQELRHKESDRISALGQELHSLGIDFTETLDGFIIRGGKPIDGGMVTPHGDHRLAMALALAGLTAQSPVTIQNAQIIRESFPEFPSVLRALGADLEVSN